MATDVPGLTLNSVADAARAISTAIDNSGSLKTHLSLDMSIAEQGGNRDALPYAAVYLLPSQDGTNYAYGDASTAPPSTALLCNIPFLGSGSIACQNVVTDLPMPPYKFKIVVENQTGQAFAASGNTLKYETYSKALG